MRLWVCVGPKLIDIWLLKLIEPKHEIPWESNPGFQLAPNRFDGQVEPGGTDCILFESYTEAASR